MRKILIPPGALLLLAAFSSFGHAQCLPCHVLGEGSGGPVPNEIYVQCAPSDCANECGICTEFRFWNEYLSGCTIDSIGATSDVGAQYSVCSAIEYDSACAWNFHPGPGNDTCVGDPNCICCAIDHPLSWIVSTNHCTVGYGDCAIINYCGPSCEKITWHIYFSNGSECSFQMKDIHPGPQCCKGDG